MRKLVALALGIAVGIFGFTAGFGLTGSWLGAILIGALAAGVCGVWFHARPPVAIDPAACSRGLVIVAALGTLLALVQVGRLAVFMIDPSRVGYSGVPASDWEVKHSCLSAYFVSAQVVSTTPNIYDDRIYNLPDDDPAKPRKARMIGPFRMDVYEYPPPFLILPRLVRLVTPEFLPTRMLWFGLNGLVVLLAMLLVAGFLGPAAGTRAILLSPLVWAAIPTISTLQKGNVQALVIAGSMIAMALFERRRWAAGGALLAFATVSKLYPGLLIVYLLARRQWRAVAWTAAMAIAFVVVSYIDVGRATYAAFLQHLPGLVGGEAFPAFRNPAAMAINYSVPGLVFKLHLFGVPGMSFGAAKLVGWIYTLVATAVIVWVARRPLRDDEKPRVWLGILILATLRSPFLPQAYAGFPALWLLTLMAASCPPTARVLGITLVTWAALNIFWPLDWAIDPRLLAIASGVPQAVTIALAVLALRTNPPGVDCAVSDRDGSRIQVELEPVAVAR
jgi:alpha-1,2-mannosyltransferase